MHRTPIVFALLLAAAPATVSAQEAPQTASIRVGYADLDLGSSAGIAKLDARLALAADKLCKRGITPELAQARAAYRCRVAALAAAEDQRRLAIAGAHTERLLLAARR